MWDRIPQKDIFQGNYSTCCIGMNEANGSAMPHYLLNTTFNMIELVDNKTGSVIGNALCYMAVDENGSPMFIVDNIEIANSRKPSDAVGKEIRNSIVEYASKVVKEVTGKDDIPIYMGGSYNDVPIDDLPKEKGSVKLLGQVDCDDIYMDLFGGWGNPAEIKNNVELLKLR